MTGLKLHLPPDFVDRAYSVFLLTNCEDYSPNDFSCRRFACVSPLSLGSAAARGTSPTSCAVIAHLFRVSSSGVGSGPDSTLNPDPFPVSPAPAIGIARANRRTLSEHLHNSLNPLATPAADGLRVASRN